MITNTLQTVGVVTSNIITNLQAQGVYCTLNQTESSGSPRTTIEVDAYDEASGLYAVWATAPASPAAFTNPVSIMISPGIAVASLPSGMVAQNLHMPRFFRVKETITDAGNTGAAATGTVGCELLN